MQPYGIDVGVSGLFGRELGGAAQFAQCFVGSLEAGERQTQRVMQPRILWRCDECRAQHVLALPIPAQTPIQIGEVDRRGRKLRVQAESGVVFSLGLWGTAPARVEGAERGTRLGSIGIELLGSDELACGALEPCTVGRRLVCGWSRGLSLWSSEFGSFTSRHVPRGRDLIERAFQVQ